MLEANLWVFVEYHTAGCSSKICWSMPPLIKSIWIFLQKFCNDLKNLTTAITKLTHHTVSLKIFSLLICISQTLRKHYLWLLRGYFLFFFFNATCFQWIVLSVRDYCIVLVLCTVRAHRNLCIPKHGTDLINYIIS